METKDAVGALAALAHDTRLKVFRLLVTEGPVGLPAGEIATRLGVPPPTLSAHLGQLERAGLANSRREERRIFYAVDIDGTRRLLRYLTEDCCQGQPQLCGTDAVSGTGAVSETGAVRVFCAGHHEGMNAMADRPYNVLFLCTGNSARSILAECLLNRLGEGKFRAYSAGSQPKGEVHPMALDLLKRLNDKTDDLRSKSWDEFALDGAPSIDFVITVCGHAASEVCPVWPGKPMTAHWGIDDPAAVTGAEEEQRQAFETAYARLERRIRAFLDLPIAELDPPTLQARLDSIGRQGAKP